MVRKLNLRAWVAFKLATDAGSEKCDAERPICGTCKRSHRYAVNRSKNRQNIPDLIECTYDEEPDWDVLVAATESAKAASTSTPEEVSSRDNGKGDLEQMVEKLERIIEAQDNAITELLARTASHPQQSKLTPSPSPISPAPLVPRANPPTYPASYAQHPLVRTTFEIRQIPDDQVKRVGLFRPEDSEHEQTHSLVEAHPNPMIGAYSFTWPTYVPQPDLLHHLVDVFFKSYPYAKHMLHRQSFETALSLSPSSPGFPKTSLLHAICAVASFHTQYVDPPTHRAYLFNQAGQAWSDTSISETFAERQAFFAGSAWIRDLVLSGYGSIDLLRTNVLLFYFHHCNARYTHSWSSAGLAMSLATCFRLEQSDQMRKFQPRPIFDDSMFPPLPATSSTLEGELRRNCFWLAYVADRILTMRFGWNQFVDDKSITQTLPADSWEIEQAIPTPPEKRQHLDCANLYPLMTIHPVNQTDSFILFIKSVILMSRVKEFNGRYRSRSEDDYPSAVRASEKFLEMERLIEGSIKNVPSSYRDPIQGGALDVTLFAALTMQWGAMIVLHTVIADYNDLQCPSAAKAIVAARRILNLLCIAVNCSSDLSLLDPACASLWLVAAQDMTAYAVALAKMGYLDEARRIRSEVEVIIDAFVKVAERLPIGYREFRWLTDELLTTLDPLLSGIADAIAIT